MNSTIYLDPTAWDLALDSSGNIAVASLQYAQAQDCASALRTFLGECYYNTAIGVPYWGDILGQRPPLELMKAKLIDAALTVPGVVSAKVFITEAGRTVSGQVQVTDVTGAVSTSGF